MRLPKNIIYGRLFLLYFLLLTGFSILVVAVTIRFLIVFADEAEQQVNRDVALEISRDLGPLLRTWPNTSGLREAMRRVSAVHPRSEVYLLDAGGRVLAALSDSARVEETTVSVTPVLTLIEGTARLPVYGEDPRRPGKKDVFSAAEVQLGAGGRGYVYVILRGAPMALIARSVWDSYTFRILAALLSLILIASLAFGVAMFQFETRPLRRMIVDVKRYGPGAYDLRIPEDLPDEFGHLARVFNEMAATIEAQVEALRSSDEARREMVAAISHDLRTPLAATWAHVESLQRQGSFPPEHRKQLAVVLKGLSQIDRLLGQLNDLSRLDVGRATTHPEPFSIAELTQDIVQKLKLRAEERGIHLQALDGPGLPWVSGDISLIERVLVNVVENAILNTPEGGSVRVRLEEDPGRIHVRVTDTGYGIAPEEIPLVTKRFYRTKHSRDLTIPGTGLGLAIANEIMELHGSTLRIESTLGKGTTVMFTLPTVS